jgi:ERCC4-type nuclease
MNLKVDVRERDLIEQIKHFISILPIYKDINLVIETLPLGDIIIENNGIEKLIIERKTIRDLGASIKDGRYEEQSYRLNGVNVPNHNIIYLIEGDINKINKFVDKTDKITIYSAMFSLNYYKGFSVIRTMSLEETALFICNSANKLRRGEADGKKGHFQPFPDLKKVQSPNLNDYLESNIEQDATISLDQNVDSLGLDPSFKKDDGLDPSLKKDDGLDPPFSKVEKVEKVEYVDVIKKVKKENITPQNIDEIMLCQIPGISSTTASAIIGEFKTIYNLTKEIEAKGIECLKNLSYTTSKNQTRKINKTTIVNLQKFLLKT